MSDTYTGCQEAVNHMRTSQISGTEANVHRNVRDVNCNSGRNILTCSVSGNSAHMYICAKDTPEDSQTIQTVNGYYMFGK
jgi:hypothetical protein